MLSFTKKRCGLLAFLSTLLVGTTAHAWLLHEHTRITYEGLSALTPRDREVLQAAWDVFRRGRGLGPRLCEEPVQPSPAMSLGEGRVCVGLSTLPALGGDHSCSPDDLDEMLGSPAVVDIVLEAQRVAAELRDEPDVLQRIDARRRHDIELQLVDAEYLTRADSNGAHFQISRRGGEPGRERDREALNAYLRHVLSTGMLTNATALYVNFHAAALESALRARDECQPIGQPCQAAYEPIQRAILAESFALHFLEDAFSSGHFVASYGSTSQRFGTHDYYSRHGLEAHAFNGDAYVAHGDLFLTDEDARRSARSVTASLTQVLRAMAPDGGAPDHSSGFTTSLSRELSRGAPDYGFNACHGAQVPAGLDGYATAGLTAATTSWPMPTLRDPDPPRFQAEYGWFFGASVGNEVALLRADDAAVVDLRLRAALRVGFGLDAVMSRYMDGAIFADFLYGTSWRPAEGRAISGFGARLHLPFAVVPGDGLIAPLAQLGFKPAVWVAKQAALGTVYGQFERMFLLGEEQTLQICAGRDASFIYYPGDRGSPEDERYELTFPLLNMRIGRAYSGKIATDLNLDLGAQVTIPTSDQATGYGGYLAISIGSRLYP